MVRMGGGVGSEVVGNTGVLLPVAGKAEVGVDVGGESVVGGGNRTSSSSCSDCGLGVAVTGFVGAWCRSRGGCTLVADSGGDDVELAVNGGRLGGFGDVVERKGV